jgi:GPH family glycoside/pentoside/hexuronide:cation symporter
LLSFAFIAFYPLSEKRMKQVTVELEEKRKEMKA